MNITQVRDKLNEYIELGYGDHPAEIEFKVEGANFDSLNVGEVDTVIQDVSVSGEPRPSDYKRPIFIRPKPLGLSKQILEDLLKSLVDSEQ